jgi:hypothetical protein
MDLDGEASNRILGISGQLPEFQLQVHVKPALTGESASIRLEAAPVEISR